MAHSAGQTNSGEPKIPQNCSRLAMHWVASPHCFVKQDRWLSRWETPDPIDSRPDRTERSATSELNSSLSLGCRHPLMANLIEKAEFF